LSVRAPEPSTEPKEAEPKAPEAQVEAPKESMVVERDKLAGRYVQTFFDVETHSVVRQYPAEAQLVFARAMNAYLKLLAEQKLHP
jgi:uncharacterized FlaG/YvyC family protein